MTPNDIAMAAAAHATPRDYGNAEINAIARIVEAMESIDEEAHARVLRWVISKFEIEV